MRFNPDLLELIDANQLDADFGGSYNFEFEPQSYWDQIIKCVYIIDLSISCSLILFQSLRYRT